MSALAAPKKILIVDDDDAVVDLVRANLEFDGFEVIAARDGLEGLERVAADSPDLVILDIHMPKLNGWDVLFELRTREEYLLMPVIMLTVEDSGESITAGWERGVDCYLPKPFDPVELTIMVRRLIEVAEEERFRPDMGV